MNAIIIHFLKEVIRLKEIQYQLISEKTGISYQRLMNIFNQNATISGSELLCICKILEVKQSELMALLDRVA